MLGGKFEGYAKEGRGKAELGTASLYFIRFIEGSKRGIARPENIQEEERED